MRKIALCTPASGGLPVYYVRNLIQALSAKFEDVAWMPVFMMGQGVQIARNECVKQARKMKADELVFLDHDLDVTVAQWGRLLSHEDEEIVCSLYCKKTLDSHFHVQGWTETEVENEKGLLRVKQAAIGFSKIKMTVFDKIQAKNPDRVGWLREKGTGEWALWDFFPMELMGPNTPLARLNDIRKILDETVPEPTKISRIREAITQQHDEKNIHLGEDYWFCRLAREADIPIYLDTQLIIKHHGDFAYPANTEDLIRELKQDWRADERKGIIFP